jgi:hypothetical protein
VILEDEHGSWRSHQYQRQLWGCSVDFQFSIAKLVDYRQNWQVLAESHNPFTVVVMAHLKAQEMRKEVLLMVL